ncbi:hypothetical protein ccbrp13_14540 [Ktedonobacteria bacterium brp13]|nr:hypothetical protein ccbrp13_14540 [Ktedonobacteria bacterium brp13]
MIPNDKQWERNTSGLHATAQQKAKETKKRAEQAIALLLKEQRPINFKVVAETAHISTAWLYANHDIKMRIIHLRSQQKPKTQGKISFREQASNASKDAMIATLQKRVKEQAEKIRELQLQLEVASGLLYQQKRE